MVEIIVKGMRMKILVRPTKLGRKKRQSQKTVNLTLEKVGSLTLSTNEAACCGVSLSLKRGGMGLADEERQRISLRTTPPSREGTRAS